MVFSCCFFFGAMGLVEATELQKPSELQQLRAWKASQTLPEDHRRTMLESLLGDNKNHPCLVWIPLKALEFLFKSVGFNPKISI